jgi:hypothetical protein
MYCRNCGHQLPDDARFCPNCGHPVDDEAGAAAPPTTGTPPPLAPPGGGDQYAARLEIDYPDRELNRVSTFFRIFTAIPIVILLSLVEGVSWTSIHGPSASSTQHTATVGGGILIAPVVLMLLFRRKYPGWWFEWNRELVRFSTRVAAYLALLDDRYPSTDEAQAVQLDLERPDGERLSRGMPLIKWFLAIPHYIVLVFLGLAAFFVVVFAWFAILFTGRYPRGAFEFVVGVFRWALRVDAYAFLLITDEYPPFRLGP